MKRPGIIVAPLTPFDRDLAVDFAALQRQIGHVVERCDPTEALLVGALGGVGGIVVTTVYANVKGWATLLPPIAIFGGVAAALVISAVAGLYPAIRAARLSTTEALRTT